MEAGPGRLTATSGVRGVPNAPRGGGLCLPVCRLAAASRASPGGSLGVPVLRSCPSRGARLAGTGARSLRSPVRSLPLTPSSSSPSFPQGCWRTSCPTRRPSAARCNGTPATTPQTATATHPPNPPRQSHSISTATTPTSITSGRTTTTSTTTTTTTTSTTSPTPHPCCRSPQGLASAAAGSDCACWS